MRPLLAPFAAAVALIAASAPAQYSTTRNSPSFRDFTMVRYRPMPYESGLLARAGMIGSFADDEQPQNGLEDELGVDGAIHYRDSQFSAREARLDVYAGRDGGYIGLVDDSPDGQSQRLELTGRWLPFYREGFYQDEDYVPTGRYEGTDWGVYAAVGTKAADGLALEVGPYVRWFDFSRNDGTAATYVIPESFFTFGVRAYAEHNTLQLDQGVGQPYGGFILTLMLEWETNDSDQLFGVPGTYETDLASGLWRGRGHLEWYFPQEGLGVWEIGVDGSLTDEQDRVTNYDAQAPAQGHLWVDGELGFRLQWGGLSFTPYGKGQYVQTLRESGFGSDNNTFFGGGARLRYDFSQVGAIYAEYSYLENPSRPPVSFDEDVYGNSILFVGGELRLGGS